MWCPLSCVGFSSEGANRKHEVRKFLELATLMKGLDHINILPLVGVCVEEGYVPLVLYPHCEEGSVHSFLERSKFSPERQQVCKKKCVLCDMASCVLLHAGRLYMEHVHVCVQADALGTSHRPVVHSAV